jgi:beta-N-acetylhexosaminidase
VIAVLVAVASVLAACAPTARPSAASSTAATGPDDSTPLLPDALLPAPADNAPAPVKTTPSPRSAKTPPAVSACLPASLADRAARVLIVGLPNVTAPTDDLVAELRDVGVGGVMLTNVNVESRPQVTALVSALRAGSRGPLLVAADEEPGRVRTFEDLFGPLPSARRLAAEGTVDDVRQAGAVSGRDLVSLDVNMALAPDADVDGGPWDGIIGDRSFSDDPATASTDALAYARGLESAGVTPVVKHFPGHGRATADDHVSAPDVSASLPDLLATDVRPFADAIAAGAPVVMMANVAYDALEPNVPASMSPAAYSLLRRLGFTGAAITDSVGMGAVNLRWDFDEAAVSAVAAGADGVLATDGWQARRMRDALVAAVQSGQLSESRLDEAAGRMMALAGGDPVQLSCRSEDMPSLR